MYADYDFYTTHYHGTVNEFDFPRLSVKASAFLDYYTMGKAKFNSELEPLKMACCALVDKYAEIESLSAASKKSVSDAVSVGKKSESVGSYSVTYQTADEFRAQEQALKAELSEIARMYLAGTNLLYRGGCRNVCPSHCNCL